MKGILFTFCFVLYVFVGNSQTSVIKTSPIPLAFGFFNACYEKAINDKSAFELSGSFFFKLAGVDVTAGGLGAGYKFYLTKKVAPRGFYIMPSAGFSIGSSGDYSYSQIDFGALLGIQMIGGSGFTFDVGIGPKYAIFGGDSDNIGFDGGSGILPQLRTAIGFAW